MILDEVKQKRKTKSIQILKF